jgi:hypothetical protein
VRCVAARTFYHAARGQSTNPHLTAEPQFF